MVWMGFQRPPNRPDWIGSFNDSASENILPRLISRPASITSCGVTLFSVPIWSSFPHRPQFDSFFAASSIAALSTFMAFPLACLKLSYDKFYFAVVQVCGHIRDQPLATASRCHMSARLAAQIAVRLDLHTRIALFSNSCTSRAGESRSGFILDRFVCDYIRRIFQRLF